MDYANIILTVLGLAFFIAIFVIHSKNVTYVRENSICLKNILNLNNIQNFRSFNPHKQYNKFCNSKQQFDNFNIDNYLVGIIDSEFDRYTKIINDLKYNKEQYGLYQTKFNQIINNTNCDYEQLAQNSPILNAKFFRQLEIAECNKEKLKPQMNLKIDIFVEYTSPAGRNSYNKTYTANESNIEYYCNQCIKSRQYKQSARYQRSIMTDKLRYQVLNRDGHRCVICGRSAKDGVKLHIDHIVPVSKGGKTEMSNLRTLCERCNLGKGNSYNPNGYN